MENIQNPFHITLPYQLIYAQAKELVLQGKFIYWFELDEIEQLEQHNEEFRAQDSEEQLLPILFDVPAEGKGEFMTTAEISDKLVTYGGIKNRWRWIDWACCWEKPDTELLHEVAEMLEFADGLYISEITNKSMLIEDS